MIRHADQMNRVEREHMRGGEGTATLVAAFEAGEYQSETRLFSRITIPAGASIGYHVHQGEEEFFYFLSGTAEFNDNGVLETVEAGDATITVSGQGHAVRNRGDKPLEIFAVIVKVTG